jgi:hypothetical protein
MLIVAASNSDNEFFVVGIKKFQISFFYDYRDFLIARELCLALPKASIKAIASNFPCHAGIAATPSMKILFPGTELLVLTKTRGQNRKYRLNSLDRTCSPQDLDSLPRCLRHDHWHQ